MVLFLHNRYRTTGGEERTVAQLLELVRERLNEPAQLLARDSQHAGRGRAAAGLLLGGLQPRDVTEAVRLTGARVLHAHNLHPLFGWRALAAAKAAGARVVLHLHQYRLVCATGVCFVGGEECTRCHARNTLPGVVHNCRGSRGEALAYGAALALWQRRIAREADAVIVPSEFARERLRELGAPLDFDRVHVIAPPVASDEAKAQPGRDDDVGGRDDVAGRDDAGGHDYAEGHDYAGGEAVAPVEDGYALVVSRLAPEKGVDVAIDACREAGRPLVVAGDGPLREDLRARAEGAEVRFAGSVDEQELRRLRAAAALALVPSRSAETFGIAAAEAMAAGLPVVASRIGALPELVPEEGLVQVGDASALAVAMKRMWGDAAAAARARERVKEVCAPELVARRLEATYAA